MERDVAFRIHPAHVAKVGCVDDQRIALPMPDRVSAVVRRYVVAVFTSIGGNNFEAVEGLRQQYDKLRSLNDLADKAYIYEAHVQRAERRRHASQRRVVLVAQGLSLFHSPWL